MIVIPVAIFASAVAFVSLYGVGALSLVMPFARNAGNGKLEGEDVEAVSVFGTSDCRGWHQRPIAAYVLRFRIRGYCTVHWEDSYAEIENLADCNGLCWSVDDDTSLWVSKSLGHRRSRAKPTDGAPSRRDGGL